MPSEAVVGLRIAVQMCMSSADACRHSGDRAGAAVLEHQMKLFGARIRQESNDPTREVPVISVCANCGGPSLCANCGGPT